jgi:predicted O-linked N-acetylglucosamine transferase (SPINDLY family)
MAHQKLSQHAQAAAALLQAAQLAPSFFEAAHDLGLALHALGRYADALPHFERAAMLRPTSFEAHFNHGINFGKLRRYADELACYEQALRIDGTNEQLLENFGLALIEMREFSRAVVHFQRMLTLYPGHDIARGALLHAKMRVSDWEGLAEELPKLHHAIADGRNCIAPHHLIALPSTPAEQLAVAQQFTGQYAADDSAVFTRTERTRSDRIRLAYMSSDFRIHPSAFLMARHYELHDRARFEVTAISIGASDQSPIRHRLEAAFDRFVDAHAMQNQDIAQKIHDLNIDILVDLNGYTANARPGVMVHRPAPLQVAYLGFPGTSGAPFIDYLIADRTVVPEADWPSYSEKIIYLPDTYWATDSTREIDQRALTRADAGLEDGHFVLCCFNDSYKITPQVFDVWMRLLLSIDDSVLWLQSKLPEQQANLLAEAGKRGVAAERLVFAPYLEQAQHLRRMQLADLFLDTLPCNAHTLATDSLWAGVPLVTCTGNTFAGRVATSLLRAVGMPELITSTLAEYEARVVELARDRSALHSLRDKLGAQLHSSPLFDSARFTRHFEAGIARAWARHQAGLGAEHIFVDGASG